MGLFDIFTGDPYKEAAAKQQQYLTGVNNQIQSNIADTSAKGIAALQSGQGAALGDIRGGTATARGDIQQYSPQAIAALLAGQNAGAGALTAGAAGGLAALEPLSSLAGKFGAAGTEGTNIAQGAYGLGPMSGEVQAAFQNSPGFKSSVDIGLEGILRNANASGMAAGGNTLRSSGEYATNAALQDYDKWRTGVAGVGQNQAGLYIPQQSQLTSTAGTGGANIATGTAGRLSDLYSGTGTNAANIYQGTGTNLANLAQQSGIAQGGVDTGTGTNIANLLSQLSGQQIQGQGQTIAPMTQSYGTAAAGQMAGSQNLWNLIGSGVSAGAKLLPGLA
jgi:trimeric autotransporter adhesin